MSELSTNDEHAEELPDLRVDEDTSSSTRSVPVPTDESLDLTTIGNTPIATLPSGDDTPLNLQTPPVVTRNSLLEALDLRTSPVRDRNPLLVDIANLPTTLPTRNDDLDATEQTSARSDISGSCLITSDNQIEPPVCVPTENEDSGAPGISNTLSPQQIPVFESRNITGELSNATHNGGSLGTPPNSRTDVQAQTVTAKIYPHLPFQSRSMWDSDIQWEHRAAEIQSSTSSGNITGGQSSTNRYGPTFNRKCVGQMYPGVYHRHKIYDTYKGERLYECATCGSQFWSENDESEHFLGMHNVDNYLPLECNVCGWVHTGQKTFQCTIGGCEARYWHKKDFEWHFRSHTCDRPFKCKFCGRGFWRKALFEAHRTILV